MKSNEIIWYLPITNPGFAGSKPPGGFIIRSIKRVPRTPREVVVNSKLSSWNVSTGLRHWIQSIERSCKVSFLKKSCYAVVTKRDMYLFFVHSLQLFFFFNKVFTKESNLKEIQLSALRFEWVIFTSCGTSDFKHIFSTGNMLTWFF